MTLPPALQAQLKALSDRIDAFSLRERGLIFVGVMAAIFYVALSLVLTPLRTEHSKLESAARAKNERVQSINKEIQLIATAAIADIDAPQRDKIASLEKELTVLDQQLEQITGGTVGPRQMAKLLEQMLARNGALELVRIENLPSAPAVPEEASTGNAPVAAGGATIYKHGVRLELRGRYFDIVEYLKAVEKLPWKVFWGRVSLESDKYPVSTVTLVVYTLSRYPAWVGI